MANEIFRSAPMNSRLQPSDVQVMFADLQPGLITSSRTVAPESLATAASVLAKIASLLDLPMTFSVVPENGRSGIVIPELQSYSTSGNTFGRVVTSPFLEPSIVGALANSNRKTLVISGFSVEVAVLQSALDALEAGYSVLVPVDAIGSRSERTENAAIRQIEHAGGITTSVLSLATRLVQDLSHPPGSDVLAVLKTLR